MQRLLPILVTINALVGVVTLALVLRLSARSVDAPPASRAAAATVAAVVTPSGAAGTATPSTPEPTLPGPADSERREIQRRFARVAPPRPRNAVQVLSQEASQLVSDAQKRGASGDPAGAVQILQRAVEAERQPDGRDSLRLQMASFLRAMGRWDDLRRLAFDVGLHATWVDSQVAAVAILAEVEAKSGK